MGGMERQQPQRPRSALRTNKTSSSFSEGTPKAPEPVASLQEEKNTHDIDNDLDSGNSDDLMFNMNHHGNLVQLAKDLSISVADIMLMKTIFETYDVNKNGVIESEEFHKAVEDLVQLQGCEVDVTKEDLRTMTENHWHATVGSRGSLCFKEFVRWYLLYGFSEYLLLTREERLLRRLAKEHGVSSEFVSQIKIMFDSYDKDRSGEVEIDEFKQILYTAMKVPKHVALPMSRVRYFLSQIKMNGSGAVTFEEFLCWWIKYSDNSSTQGMKHTPFEDHYRCIRRIGHRFL